MLPSDTGRLKALKQIELEQSVHGVPSTAPRKTTLLKEITHLNTVRHI